MCGVFGFSILNSATTRMAEFLAYSMEGRGADSWGGSDGQEFIKKVGPISGDFWVPQNWRQGIFHTRFKTVGEISERNAHPFIVENGPKTIIGIHNGSVSNWAELNRTHNRQCQVDSEHIFHHIAEGKSMEDLQGRGTIVWFDEARMLHLARWNFGDLEVAILEDNGVVFCSELKPLQRAARMAGLKIKTTYQALEDGLEHVIVNGEVHKRDRMGFSYYVPTQSTTNYAGWYAGRESDVSQGWKRCKKCHLQETKEVVCVSCARQMRMSFEREFPNTYIKEIALACL